jgi:hypothetical protein
VIGRSGPYYRSSAPIPAASLSMPQADDPNPGSVGIGNGYRDLREGHAPWRGIRCRRCHGPASSRTPGSLLRHARYGAKVAEVASTKQVMLGARVKPVLELEGLRFRDLNGNGVLDPTRTGG